MKNNGTIDTSACTAGMQLAEPIHDDNGMLLFIEGTILTDKHISHLKEINIATVTTTLDEQLSEEELLLIRKQTQERLDRLFRNVMSNPLMQQLYNALIDYRCGNN